MKQKLLIAAVCVVGVFTLVSFQKTSFDLKASVTRGKDVYVTYCISCHMENGEGLEGAYPPLAKSDYLMADKKRAILQVINGANGEMKVNGVVYNGEMPGIDITDQEVSDVLNYVRNSFGNKGAAVTPEEVKASRVKK